MKKKSDVIEYEDGTRVKLGKDDSPEWTEEMFKKAKRGPKALREIFGAEAARALAAGKATVRPIGRPRKEATKPQVTLRLDPEVLDSFKAGGKGWQTRINQVLREWVDTHASS